MKKIIYRSLGAALVVTVLAALTQTASAVPPAAPDVTSTAGLFGLAGAALVAIRRLVR
jgi:xanthosine utilization system XapX-like protein